MLNPRNLKNGEEQYEVYFSHALNGNRVQYDYRHFDGDLFSTIGKSVDECRKEKERWVLRKEDW